MCRRLPQSQKALRGLPRTLDQIYERIFSRIGDQYWDDVITILHWLWFPFRRLGHAEVSDALSISFIVNSFPPFYPDGRLSNPIKDLLTMLHPPVTINENRRVSLGQVELRLAHASVDEYVVSTHSAKYTLINFKHSVLEESCLEGIYTFNTAMLSHTRIYEEDVNGLMSLVFIDQKQSLRNHYTR